MSAPIPLFTRVMPSRLLPVGLLVTAVAASLAAVLVDDDAVDTALGVVAGACVVLLLVVVVLQVLASRVDRRVRDRQALDGLEPLRAALRDSRRTAPRTPQAGAPRPVRDDGPA